MKAVIGLDTSCYTTSVAAASLQDGRILHCRQLLSAQGTPGLRQSEALFRHVKNLPGLMDELFAMEEITPAAFCASTTPRPVEGSYMPVFLAGESLGRSLAAAFKVPFLKTSHQEGHITAGLLESGLYASSGEPFIALHLSGGTTELILCGEKQSLVGGTLDITLGQLIDRAGVLLGMTFPCGPQLEKLAIAQSAEGAAKGLISSSSGGLHCSLSGAETQMRKLIGALSPAELALEVFSCAERTISKLIVFAAKELSINNFLLVGGVASSGFLRESLISRVAGRSHKIKLYFGKKEYCSDNAVGVALNGAKIFRDSIQQHV
ncbi:MAG: O-sialoglycoprotein endopeptidase [Christensenellales bacterium]|jgi:N6-L-threonylcarbamoyladenine synthase